MNKANIKETVQIYLEYLRVKFKKRKCNNIDCTKKSEI